MSGDTLAIAYLVSGVLFILGLKGVTSPATARRGNITGHKRQLVFTYLTGLVFPGLAAFLLPGRLMNVMLFG